MKFILFVTLLDKKEEFFSFDDEEDPYLPEWARIRDDLKMDPLAKIININKKPQLDRVIQLEALVKEKNFPKQEHHINEIVKDKTAQTKPSINR